MNKGNVQLPPDDPICWVQLKSLISEAIHPDLRNTVGISCVTGKSSFSEATGTFLPFKLSKEDIAALNKILPHLPKLYGRMTREEANIFMDAYRLHPDRPQWEPILVDQAAGIQSWFDQAPIGQAHGERVQKAINSGEIRAVDCNHVPVKYLSMDTYIPRDDAIKYLVECGLYGQRPVDAESEILNYYKNTDSTNKKDKKRKKKSKKIHIAIQVGTSSEVSSSQDKAVTPSNLEFHLETPPENAALDINLATATCSDPPVARAQEKLRIPENNTLLQESKVESRPDSNDFRGNPLPDKRINEDDSTKESILLALESPASNDIRLAKFEDFTKLESDSIVSIKDGITEKSEMPAPIVESRKENTREDLLVPAIRHAQASCGNPYDVKLVWPNLRKLAEEKMFGLTGFDGFKGVKWMNSRGKEKFLDYDGLRARLQRMKAKEPPQITITDDNRR